jgi:hypothetical protein
MQSTRQADTQAIEFSMDAMYGREQTLNDNDGDDSDLIEFLRLTTADHT